MNGARALWLVVALAIAAIAAIIGMLLVESVIWDTVLFGIAALPPLIGLWRWRAERR